MSAETLENHSSFQGYSGILNTPNAEVMQEGKGEFLFSNQLDYAYSDDPRYKERSAQNYFLTLGFLPHLEITGRATEYNPNPGSRDLSAGLKFQLPFYRSYLPRLAFGMQDIGGKADNFRSTYAVLSQEFWRLRASLGYGVGPDRLDGLFGGLEFKAHDWLYLLAENDHVDTHLGLRLNTPSRFFDTFSLALYAKTNIDDPGSNYNLGVSLQFDLGKTEQKRPAAAEHSDGPKLSETAAEPASRTKEVLSASQHSRPYEPAAILKTPDEELAHKLAKLGFENITIGEKGGTLLIAYENQVFEHNELDGVGVVLHALLTEKSAYEKVLLVIRKSGMDVAAIFLGSLDDARLFLEEGSPRSYYRFKRSVSVPGNIDYSGFHIAVDRHNSSLFKTRIELSPGLKTFVATEYGLLDYLVSLRSYVQWNLYRGVDLDLLYDTPLFWSDDLDEKEGRYRYANRGNELQSLMLNNTDRFGPLFSTLSIGKYKSDYLGIMEQLLYQHGRQKVKLQLGYFENQERDDDNRRLYLASYRYYYPKKDLYIELEGGQYWNRDRGYGVKVKRFFGDTLIGFFFSDTEYDNYAGISLEFPLTPRRVPNSRYLQIKGKKDFSYALRSTVMRDDDTNTINTGGAVAPVVQSDIENDFLNRDRLNRPYIMRHLYRIREAYETIPVQ